MKVAQYEVLGNDAKRNARPDRDDRTVWLLVSYIWLRERKQPIDRPVRDGPLFMKANPATSYWATFIGSLRDRRSPSRFSIAS
jgi:hypothetical protein